MEAIKMKTFFLTLLVAMSIVALGNSHAHAVGAVIVEDTQCVISSDASGLDVDLITMDYQKIVTPQGNVHAVCRFVIPAGSEPKKAEKRNNFSCKVSTPDGVIMTEDTQSVVTPAGKAVLTCRYLPE
jgi:hypothetical protein